MVICDKYNFTFLRLPKNASSSLSEFFIKNFCSKEDVWTEVNDCGIKSNNVDPKIIQKYREEYRFIHLTLEELVNNNLLTVEQAHNKNNIAVLRNPIERQLSLFFFLNKRPKHRKGTSVEEFRETFKYGHHITDPSNKILQTDYVKVNNQDLGNWWLYENLNNHINDFVNNNNVEIKSDLKRFKSINKANKSDIIDEYYDKKTMDAVLKYYEKDFEKYYELKSKYE
jgi:hypothetical protein